MPLPERKEKDLHPLGTEQPAGRKEGSQDGQRRVGGYVGIAGRETAEKVPDHPSRQDGLTAFFLQAAEDVRSPGKKVFHDAFGSSPATRGLP